jgi:hypothetical protein
MKKVFLDIEKILKQKFKVENINEEELTLISGSNSAFVNIVYREECIHVITSIDNNRNEVKVTGADSWLCKKRFEKEIDKFEEIKKEMIIERKNLSNRTVNDDIIKIININKIKKK